MVFRCDRKWLRLKRCFLKAENVNRLPSSQGCVLCCGKEDPLWPTMTSSLAFQKYHISLASSFTQLLPFVKKNAGVSYYVMTGAGSDRKWAMTERAPHLPHSSGPHTGRERCQWTHSWELNETKAQGSDLIRTCKRKNTKMDEYKRLWHTLNWSSCFSNSICLDAVDVYFCLISHLGCLRSFLKARQCTHLTFSFYICVEVFYKHPQCNSTPQR